MHENRFEGDVMTWDPASGSATRGPTSSVVREWVAVFKLALLRVRSRHTGLFKPVLRRASAIGNKEQREQSPPAE